MERTRCGSCPAVLRDPLAWLLMLPLRRGTREPWVAAVAMATVCAAVFVGVLIALGALEGVLLPGRVEAPMLSPPVVVVVALVATILIAALLALTNVMLGRVFHWHEEAVIPIAGADVQKWRRFTESWRLCVAVYAGAFALVGYHQYGNVVGLERTVWQYPGGSWSLPSISNLWFLLGVLLAIVAIARALAGVLGACYVVRTALSRAREAGPPSVDVTHSDGCGGLAEYGSLVGVAALLLIVAAGAVVNSLVANWMGRTTAVAESHDTAKMAVPPPQTAGGTASQPVAPGAKGRSGASRNANNTGDERPVVYSVLALLLLPGGVLAAFSLTGLRSFIRDAKQEHLSRLTSKRHALIRHCMGAREDDPEARVALSALAGLGELMATVQAIPTIPVSRTARRMAVAAWIAVGVPVLNELLGMLIQHFKHFP